MMTFLLNFEVVSIFTLIEVLKPASVVHYSKVFFRDVASIFINTFFTILLLNLFKILHIIPFTISSPFFTWIHQKPFLIQMLLYLLVTDFGVYWAHRLMHTRHCWRFHRWHHYPQYMYWGAGFRASFMHHLLFYSVGVLGLPILQVEQSTGYFIFSSSSFLISNNFMHMNTVWNSRKWEWVFITPRYHRMHHSDDIRVHNANYGAILTIWDRIFGSYINPETIPVLKFGTGEKKKHPWMILGF